MTTDNVGSGQRAPFFHPDCIAGEHNWQPWFHSPSQDKLTRHCARWNCEGWEEINLAGVASA